MSAADSAIIGVEKCGCVTLAIARPSDPLDEWSAEEIADAAGRGCSILHTTVAGARRRKHFLPVECPHDPKGWVAT